MPTERFKALQSKYEAEFRKKSTRDVLNELDSEDLLHYLQSRKMLREEATNTALAPLMHETAARKARQDLENVKQGGSLEAIAKLHSETAGHEGMELPMRTDGVLDTATALRNIQTAIQEKEKRDLDRQLLIGAQEQTTTTVNPQGQKTVTGQMVTKTGQPVSAVRTVATESAQTEPLRKEYTAQPPVHEFNKVHSGYNKLLRALNTTKNPSPFRDQAAIFSWMKILDPGSTVREGEYATVENARSVPEKIKGLYNRVLSGTILTPEQRTELLAASEDVVDGQLANVAPIVKQFAAQEKTGGHAAGSIVPQEHQDLIREFDEREAAKAKQQAPAQPAQPGAAPAAPAPQAGPSGVAQGAAPASIPTVNSPDEAPETAQFYFSPDGRKFVNKKYKPAQ